MSVGYAPPVTDPTLDAIAGKYKALAPHVPNMEVIQSADPGDGRQLEFYHPTESENPRPGKITMELFKPMDPQQREDAIAADALHYLGGHADEDETKPVDPTFHQLKQELIRSRTLKQHSIDKEAFDEDKKIFGGDQTFDDWMNHSRADAYIRGGLFPQSNPEWAKPGFFTPEQSKHFERMQAYLRTGNDSPAGLPDYGRKMDPKQAELDAANPSVRPEDRQAARDYLISLGKRTP